MKLLFDRISKECSRNITQRYSTSFSLGIRFLSEELRDPIYSIYGFVRLADEIVDSFEGYRQAEMLKKLREDVFEAIDHRISINPVLHSFQEVVHAYAIDRELIEAFLDSMEMDLEKRFYTRSLYEKYIHGSAEVVGLMCLKVFCKGDGKLYEQLKDAAMRLGSAFQKVNFLRDIRADYQELGRMYFPNVDFCNFTNSQKQVIESEIEKDFSEALTGIRQLPKEARFGVMLAYVYYQMLLKKIKAVPGEHIMQARVRVQNSQKIALLLYTCVKSKLNLI